MGVVSAPGRGRRVLHAALLATMLAWLLREAVWLRRWRAYWHSLRHTMRAPAISTSTSVPLRLERLASISDTTFRQVVRGLLFGQPLRRTPSFTETLHRSLSYLVNRRHPSSVCLADMQPHIERLQYGATSEHPTAEPLEGPRDGNAATPSPGRAPLDEASAFASGPLCWPLPWSVSTLLQLARPLASATSLPRHAHDTPPWHASLESPGVTILWREATGCQRAPPTTDDDGWGEFAVDPPPYAAGDGHGEDSTPWLLLHGIGGIDRRCVEGLVRRCGSLHGRLLIMPVHPNWETYGTVPWLHHTFPASQFVTTREFVRVIAAALGRRCIRKVHIVAWSMGTCFATMLHEECPSLDVGFAVYVDPAAALPLAGSAWRWLVEARAAETCAEFFARSRRFGLGRWLLAWLLGSRRLGAWWRRASPCLTEERPGQTEAGPDWQEAGPGGRSLPILQSILAPTIDALGAGLMGMVCRCDHLRVAPELHPCAHGCDLEGHLLNRHNTLLLLDRQDTFLCPVDHAEYLAEACRRATTLWRDGWHCGWMYGRLWLNAGEEMGEEIDAFVDRVRDLTGDVSDRW